ncbi:MAG: hypothetical protein GY847_17425 [Proteobacteria bacterium]|nr:hypothetical protein [Pseudomonadota bacterium]
MPRGPRLDAPGTLHHVHGRGIERRRVFLGEHDREDFLNRLGNLCESGSAIVYAWSLMPNHFHIALRTANSSLPTTMQRLLTGYAISFNKRHKRSGHLFQNRYKSTVIDGERYFVALVRYIHLNPVQAKIVSCTEELSRYPWTGHATLMGELRRDWQETNEVLLRFGTRIRQARRELFRFMTLSEASKDREIFSGGGLIRSSGGKREFEKRRKKERTAYDERILGSGRFVEAVLSQSESQALKQVHTKEEKYIELERILSCIAELSGVTVSEIASNSKQRVAVTARRVVSYLAVTRTGLTIAEVSRALQVSPPSVRIALEQGEKLLDDQGWRRMINL